MTGFQIRKIKGAKKGDHELLRALLQAPQELPEIVLCWKLITLDRQVQACLLPLPHSAHLLLNSIIKPHGLFLSFREKEEHFCLGPSSPDLVT